MFSPSTTSCITFPENNIKYVVGIVDIKDLKCMSSHYHEFLTISVLRNVDTYFFGVYVHIYLPCYYGDVVLNRSSKFCGKGHKT